MLSPNALAYALALRLRAKIIESQLIFCHKTPIKLSYNMTLSILPSYNSIHARLLAEYELDMKYNIFLQVTSFLDPGSPNQTDPAFPQLEVSSNRPTPLQAAMVDFRRIPFCPHRSDPSPSCLRHSPVIPSPPWDSRTSWPNHLSWGVTGIVPGSLSSSKSITTS